MFCVFCFANYLLFVICLISQSTLRAYLDLLNTTDSILQHKFFQQALRGAVRVNLKRLQQANSKAQAEDDVDMSNMSAADKKKAKAKMRKLAKKEESASESVKEIVTSQNNADTVVKPKGGSNANKAGLIVNKDTDPKGELILAKDAMEEAYRWCAYTTNRLKWEPDTYEVVADVMLQKEKFVLALRAISCGLKAQNQHPGLMLLLLKFARKYFGIGNNAPVLSPVLDEVVKETLARITGGEAVYANVEKYIEAYIHSVAANERNMLDRISAAQCLSIIGLGDFKVKSVAILLDESQFSGLGVSVKGAIAIYTVRVLLYYVFVGA